MREACQRCNMREELHSWRAGRSVDELVCERPLLAECGSTAAGSASALGGRETQCRVVRALDRDKLEGLLWVSPVCASPLRCDWTNNILADKESAAYPIWLWYCWDITGGVGDSCSVVARTLTLFSFPFSSLLADYFCLRIFENQRVWQEIGKRDPALLHESCDLQDGIISLALIFFFTDLSKATPYLRAIRGQESKMT